MRRKRSLGGWCGLGLAVAAVAGGAYAGKRYAEQNMLAAMLGSGVRAESVQWHWRQAAGCAEQVEIPLANAKDANDQTLQLYAPKLWFVYDQAALLRKRFILPRVVIEDAVISTSTDRLLSGEMVDIDFGADAQLDGLVELPSGSTSSEAPALGEGKGSPSNAQSSMLYTSKATGLAMPWLDQLQSLCESLLSDQSIQGRQVAVDADMLSERIQDYLGDRRTQAQRLVAEARDVQQQLVNMDNVLRQPQLNEVARRLEQIKDQLVKLKKDIQSSGKLLDDQQSRLMSSLLTEKKQLLLSADQYQAPLGNEMAQAVLAQIVKDRLAQPARAVIVLADLMRKPLDASSMERGQAMRRLDPQQPEFAAQLARISGKLEIDGSTWPFEAQGKFEVSKATGHMETGAAVEPMQESAAKSTNSGSAQWRMSIEAQPHSWQLEGDCSRVDGPCSITLTEKDAQSLSLTCMVDRTGVSGHGQLGWQCLVGNVDASAGQTGEQLGAAMAASYRSEALLRKLLSEALVVDEQIPKMLEFEVKQLPSLSDCRLSEATIAWLGMRLQMSATACLADVYRQTARQLDSAIATKISDQKGMTATLRNDAEQYISAQQDELRRIQATVNSLMEQQQPNYFARQPGDMAR